MKNRYIRLFAAGIAAIALMLSLNACSASLPNGSGLCTLKVDYPHGSHEKKGFIDGKGKVRCDYSSGKITDLKIQTRLQRWSGKAWVTVSGSSREKEIPKVKSGTSYTGVSHFIPCRKGILRTQSRAGAYLDGRYSGLSHWTTTHTQRGVKNPCEKPLKVVAVR